MIFGLLAQADIDWGPIRTIIGIILGLIFLKSFLQSLLSRKRAPSAPRPDPRPTPQLRSGRTDLPAPFRLKDAYVIDGDTLARGEWRIRIFGMDAPESDQPQGPAATEAMRQLVCGKTLHILPKDIDIYGRLVARVLCGSIDVGKAMVDSGHAVATSDYTRAYTSNERAARRGRKGLWQKGKIADPRAWREETK